MPAATNSTSASTIPFISYKDVQTNPARVANIVDFSQFATDLANNTVPNYVWISPDQCNDMHGRGATSDRSLRLFAGPRANPTGDAFLLNTVNAIMTSKVMDRELCHLHRVGRE